MTRKQQLEEACRPLYGKETDIKKRYKILKDAFWQAHNSGYCDAMAGRLMGGHPDRQTDYWEKACSLKYEVSALCDIYREELGE